MHRSSPTACRAGASFSCARNNPATLNWYSEQSLRLERAQELHENEGITLVNLGTAYFNCGEVERARETFQAALEVNRRVGNRRFEILASINLSNCVEDVDQAGAMQEEALHISRRTNNRDLAALALFNLGESEQRRGRFESAFCHFSESSTLYRQLNDRRILVLAQLEMVGLLRLAKGLYDEAEALLSDTFGTLEISPSGPALVRAWCERGHLHLARDRPADESIREAQEALDRLEPAPPRSPANPGEAQARPGSLDSSTPVEALSGNSPLGFGAGIRLPAGALRTGKNHRPQPPPVPLTCHWSEPRP